MKAVVAAFNQEKALVGAFSVIVQLHRLIDLRHDIWPPPRQNLLLYRDWSKCVLVFSFFLSNKKMSFKYLSFFFCIDIHDMTSIYISNCVCIQHYVSTHSVTRCWWPDYLLYKKGYNKTTIDKSRRAVQYTEQRLAELSQSLIQVYNTIVMQRILDTGLPLLYNPAVVTPDAVCG